MPPNLASAAELAWPAVIAFSWLAGELGQRFRIPRIAIYALVGFLFARLLAPVLSVGSTPAGTLLANVAFGLVLFEFGYRINLHWFRVNPWLAATALLDVALSFVSVYALCRAFGTAVISSLLIAAIAGATSPASLTRVVNELRSAGQVTERALHLTAFNCMCALFAFKFLVGFWTFDTSGDVLKALSNSAVVLLVSAALGAAFGSGMPAVLRLTGRSTADATLAFALAVVLLVGTTHLLHFSPLVASLAFGLVARHRRVTLNQTQRDFGVLGDVLIVFLFTYIAATVDWQRALAGAALGAALVVVRTAAKILAVTLLARPSGTTWRKGMLTAIAMSPLSTFVVLLVEETRAVGIDLIDAIAPVAAATLLLLWLGPLATQAALRMAGEVQEPAQPGPR
jgi:Kef-type K+ transport system membrane component KefB